jgi:CRP-like cAMP-binding protein
VPIFGGLRRETLDFLLEKSETAQRAPGGYFFREGEPGDALYVLVHGRVEVVKSRQEVSVVLSELGVGDCFGEMALIAIRPRCASIRACEDSAALRLPRHALHDLYKHDIEQFALLQMNLAREVARRLDLTDRLLLEHVELLEREHEDSAEAASLAGLALK